MYLFFPSSREFHSSRVVCLIFLRFNLGVMSWWLWWWYAVHFLVSLLGDVMRFMARRFEGSKRAWLTCVCATLLPSDANALYSSQRAPLCSSVSGAVSLQAWWSKYILPSSSSRYVTLRGIVPHCHIARIACWLANYNSSTLPFL